MAKPSVMPAPWTLLVSSLPSLWPPRLSKEASLHSKWGHHPKLQLDIIQRLINCGEHLSLWLKEHHGRGGEAEEEKEGEVGEDLNQNTRKSAVKQSLLEMVA